MADSNVVFSALISGKPKYLEIFEMLDVYVPDFIFVELANYESRIRQRAELQGTLKDFTQELFASITVIPNLAIESQSFMRAHSLCRGVDPEDIPFVALSLDLEIPLWTNDKPLTDGLRARGYQQIISSREVFDLLS